MNKLGIFMNFWEKNWDADHAKYIKKVAKMGYDILEFQAQPLLEMSDEKIRSLKKLADDEGIELTYSLGLDPAYDVSSLDENIRLGGVKYLQEIIRKMHIGGGTLLSGVSYAGWGTPGVVIDDKRPYLEQSLKSMREIIKVAEECGVTYCVEAVNRFETCIINTAKEAVAYAEEIDSPNIGVLLDTYHMNIEESSIGDAIRYVGKDRLKNFHTGENNRTAPGRGHINWDEVFSALAEIGYEGRIISEPFVMMGGEVGRDIHVFRDLVENPCEETIDKEAEYLLSFERNMIQKYAK
ncbi:MAG: sugar phosphate isomerase/epimerase family protein [Clostridia bacterium]|nr:sugar phosphate isomerase/epimerase family protein [Clostridia bacterium]